MQGSEGYADQSKVREELSDSGNIAEKTLGKWIEGISSRTFLVKYGDR